jgi:phosphoenolpyruvate synthase/pyruvate phosphate dikinase
MTDVLAGGKSSVTRIPARRETYLKYCAQPPYPAIIIGKFDPFKWVADPNRRSDYFDSRQLKPMSAAAAITGFAGAAGIVEGIVRRLDKPEDGSQLQAGEILVTVTTNVGWTPLFPRLAAIVTDVGAPLSHAAIVARELGIPAVVGCGNATMRLKTGDRVRVDGSAGTVERCE